MIAINRSRGYSQQFVGHTGGEHQGIAAEKGVSDTGIDNDDHRNETQNPGSSVLRECEWIGKVRAADSEGEQEQQ